MLPFYWVGSVLSLLDVCVLSVKLCRILDCCVSNVFNGTTVSVIGRVAAVKRLPALHFNVVIFWSSLDQLFGTVW